jgi:hypothetical protein
MLFLSEDRTMKALSRTAPLALLAVLAAGCMPTAKPPPGRAAPEIQGKDADGVAFALSDYRGKVVMLDFWGNW